MRMGSEVWDLVPRPECMNVIGTNWIYKNKSDENGTVTRNKARLVAQGYTQVEGLNFDETEGEKNTRRGG